jgi:membrane-bound lytic murein transglycosylase MltF
MVQAGITADKLRNFRRKTNKNSTNKRNIWKLEVWSLKWNEDNNYGNLHRGINKYKKCYQTMVNIVKDKVEVLSYFQPSQKKGEDQMENLGIGETIGFKWVIKKTGMESEDLICLKKGRGCWLVHTVKNLRVS